MPFLKAGLEPGLVTRRQALFTGGLIGGGVLLSGCSQAFQSDKLIANSSFQRVLAMAEGWSMGAQRFLIGGGRLAQEYSASDISRNFKGNGTLHPGGDDYARAIDTQFKDWKLTVDGLVGHPLSLGIDEIRALPSRTQITRHDCVEGWSAIGQWTGVPLGLLLKTAGVLPSAKYAVFLCADNLGGEPSKGGEQAPGQYYESLDLVDANHPQTLICHAMNGQPLSVVHGAPLRLRVERQLGYKQAKYVQRIMLTDSLHGIAGGKGGYWEDRGYEWYAGI